MNKNTKFIPWNEIDAELPLSGDPAGYIIMPATYKPGKKGPFILAVSTDVDFTLVAME